MEKLPTEIMLDILSRLPYETTINCKLVSKPWRDITSSIKTGFIFQPFRKPPGVKLCYGGEDISMQEDYSYKTLMEIDDNHQSPTKLEPPLTSDMVGSCNGLVCFSVKSKSSLVREHIYICNPMTEEYVYLPAFNYNKECNVKTDGNYFHYGFGYHHSTDEYKVVRIYFDDHFIYNEYSRVFGHDNEERGHVQVYTLGSGHGWREIGRIDHCLDYYRGGVCANGALHWMVHREKKILSFDLADEEFRMIPFPPLSPYRSFNVVYLQLMFGGYLCVVTIDVGRIDRFIDIWVLEKIKKFSSYDMKRHDEFNDFWRWSKKLSIPCTKYVTYLPFAITKSNQLLMSSGGTVFCYDLGTQVLRKLWDNCSMRNSVAIPHVNSLVSLEALGEKSKRRK